MYPAISYDHYPEVISIMISVANNILLRPTLQLKNNIYIYIYMSQPK